jgi:hypothetical protein
VQGCGSGSVSGLDPDSIAVVPDPDWESGSRSRGKKMKKNKYFLVDFNLFIFVTERYTNSTNC